MDERLAIRRSKLCERMKETGIPVAIITAWPSIFYFVGQRPIGALTNSWSANALIISAEGDTRFVCTRAYSNMLESEGNALQTIPFSEDVLIWPNRSVSEGIVEGLAQVVRERSPQAIGYEIGRMACSLRDDIAKRLTGGNFQPIDSIITELRCEKDQFELESLREAAQITNNVFRDLVQIDLRDGMTELELEKALIQRIAKAGAAPAFIQIFTGERSCYQNISPSDRVIRKGDTVLLDFGVRCSSGYCSDITRAAVIGPP